MVRVTPVTHAGSVPTQDVLTPPPGGPSERGRGLLRRNRQAAREAVIGALLVVAVAAAGVYVSIHPAATVADRWLLDVVPATGHGWSTAVIALRYPAVVVVGSVIAAVLTYGRDRPRAWACLLGPSLALVSCELVVKPLVGRTLGGTLSYPSGSTVAVVGLAVAAVLATPARRRVVTALVATVVSLWMARAVVALQWHLPTDALAGLAYGTGVMLLTDAVTWGVAVRLPRWRTSSSR